MITLPFLTLALFSFLGAYTVPGEWNVGQLPTNAYAGVADGVHDFGVVISIGHDGNTSVVGYNLFQPSQVPGSFTGPYYDTTVPSCMYFIYFKQIGTYTKSILHIKNYSKILFFLSFLIILNYPLFFFCILNCL